MINKKITVSEIKTLVKQIIKEEMMLSEEFPKDEKLFKLFDKLGFADEYELRKNNPDKLKSLVDKYFSDLDKNRFYYLFNKKPNKHIFFIKPDIDKYVKLLPTVPGNINRDNVHKWLEDLKIGTDKITDKEDLASFINYISSYSVLENYFFKKLEAKKDKSSPYDDDYSYV